MLINRDRHHLMKDALFFLVLSPQSLGAGLKGYWQMIVA
jgi:hypothetical protein